MNRRCALLVLAARCLLLPGAAEGATLSPGDLVVTNVSTSPGAGSVYRVDSSTGNRTVIASASVGTGPTFNPLDIAIGPSGSLLISEISMNAVMRIDPATGDRTIVSGSGVGSGPTITEIGGILVEPSGGILVANGIGSSSVLRVDPVTGDRTEVSSDDVGIGPNFFPACGTCVRWTRHDDRFGPHRCETFSRRYSDG